MSALLVQTPSALVAVAAAVGGSAVGVSVDGIGVAVGRTGVDVATGALHPTKKNVTNITLIICCGKYW
jgi:hypothetical protein